MLAIMNKYRLSILCHLKFQVYVLIDFPSSSSVHFEFFFCFFSAVSSRVERKISMNSLRACRLVAEDKQIRCPRMINKSSPAFFK